MRFKILWVALVALLAGALCYNFAFATQFSKQKLFGPTKSNDTLSIIAEQVVPPRSSLSLNQVMVAIYANNISAFGKGNMNILLKNKWLKIPSVKEMRAISQNQAFVIVKRHELAWQHNEVLPVVLKTASRAQASSANDVETKTLQQENVLQQEPPAQLTLPYTPLLRPVASLNFVFISPEELQRVQRDNVLPLVLKPAVIAHQIQLLTQEPMSALQTFDMWMLLSSQFQGLAIRFDQIEKDQQQIKQQLGALKQSDAKQTRQIEVLQQQIQRMNVTPPKTTIMPKSVVEFFNTLDDIFPKWPWVIATFATLLLFVLALHRYLARRAPLTKEAAPKEPIQAFNQPVTPSVTLPDMDLNKGEMPEATEVRIRPKEGSLHEAVAEILTIKKVNEETPSTSELDIIESESDFAVEDEISSLLDLARAYSDMGDHDNARTLLNRIIAEGSEAQRKDAEQLSEQLQ